VGLVKPINIVVITAPERLDHEWLNRLASEADIAHVARVGVIAAGIDLIRQTYPELVIVDRDLDQTEAAIHQIFTSVPTTLCIAMAEQLDMAALRRLVAAGARDVLDRTLPHDELMNSLRSVLETEADRRARTAGSNGGTPHSRGRGKLVVVSSPKGGVGTTTIATNLAVALRQMGGGQVVLADFDLQFGDVGVQLNLWSKYTMHDLLMKVEEIDDAMLDHVLQQHSSGIRVLLAPGTPEAAGEVTCEQIDTILDRLLERHSYVVADTWSLLDEVTMAFLRRADEVLVVATPEVPALKNTKHFLEYLRQQALVSGRITLVLNRFPSVDGISLQDVQQHLGHPVGANIPSEGQLVTHSVNRGIPVVISHPQSWVGQSLLKIAVHIAGDKVSTISLTPQSAKGRKDKDQPAGAAKERRGLLRFARREA
jgi:pilus assembly protein CpaE